MRASWCTRSRNVSLRSIPVWDLSSRSARLRDSCVSAIFASPYQITVSWDKARGLENGNGSPRHLCGLVQARALNG